MAKAPADWAGIAVRVVRGLGIAIGAVCTFVTFASLVGVITGNVWARALVALVVTLGLPAFAVDRALPKKSPNKAPPGLVADITALVLLGIAFLFVGVGQPVTRPLIVREGDRLAEDGHEVLAHVVYLLGGVRPVDALPAPAAPAPPPSSAAPAPAVPAPPSSAAPSVSASAAPSSPP
jgi:hypothetical protein